MGTGKAERDAIETHLTVDFAALAISRHQQNVPGVSTKRLVKPLRQARSATVEINGQQLTLDPELHDDARAIIDKIAPIGH